MAAATTAVPQDTHAGTSALPSCSRGWWHSALCPATSGSTAFGGAVVAQTSVAFQQRVRNRQPDGGLSGEGTSPLSRIRSLRCAPSSVRRRGHQRGGVRVVGPLENRFGGAGFDDAAEVHHRDPVGDMPDHRQVVRDEDVGDAAVGPADR